MKINHYKRIQDITIGELFPSIPGYCAFGCGNVLKGKQMRWCSSKCSSKAGWELALKREIPDVIRTELKKRDQDKDGNIFCEECDCQVHYWDKLSNTVIEWDADHIRAVCNGGGGLGLSNYRIVCKDCH